MKTSISPGGQLWALNCQYQKLAVGDSAAAVAAVVAQTPAVAKLLLTVDQSCHDTQEKKIKYTW